MKVAAHGVAARLPAGWEGTIAGQDQDLPAAATAAVTATGAAPRNAPRRRPLPVAHFATFGLPPVRGDFGSNVVDRMSSTDAFVSLVEYGPEEANSQLFSARGLPRKLDPRAFSRRMLQRTLPGHSGLQIFFTHANRAFCLYVVLGDEADAHRLVRRVEQVLATIEIEEQA